MNLAPFLKGVHPHSETYTKVSYAAQSSPLRFGSCFTEDRFTRLLRTAPERSSPQADTAELAARLSRFFAAFQSRSASNPHGEQRNSRCGTVWLLAQHRRHENSNHKYKIYNTKE